MDLILRTEKQENTMKKKQINLIIALMLAAVLCLALFLTGCGRQRGGEAPSEQNAAGEPEALSGKEEGEPEEVPAPTPTPVPELTFPDGSVHMADEKTLLAQPCGRRGSSCASAADAKSEKHRYGQ